MAEGKFATAINCMDGRVQEPVIMWFKIKKGMDYVDTITEPGPIKALSEGDAAVTESIRRRVLVSTEKHGSRIIAVVGHHDCAGNPVPKDEQLAQISLVIDLVKSWNTGAEVIGLYVNEMWNVEEVTG
jgi:carbonic anhydrase